MEINWDNSTMYISEDGKLRAGNYRTSSYACDRVLNGFMNDDLFNKLSEQLIENIKQAEKAVLTQILHNHLRRELMDDDWLLIKKVWEFNNKSYKLYYGIYRAYLGTVNIIYPEPDYFNIDTTPTKIKVQFNPIK